MIDSKIDWPLQYATMWNSNADDPTRATRRAAEFLVHNVMPWSLVGEVVVRNAETGSLVAQLLKAADQQRSVSVRPGWYYQGSKFR